MSVIKNCLLKTLLAIGPKNIPAASILLYHNVGRDGAYLTVTPENFEAQIDFLQKNNYRIISLHDLVDNLRHGHAIKPKTVVLTFDDGFTGIYDFVFPALRERHLAATFFIATDLAGGSLKLGSGHSLPVMGWEQIWEIGGTPHLEMAPHSLSHRELSALNYDKMVEEVQKSRAALEEKTGRRSDFFAYPRGKWTPEIVRVLKEKGFAAAVTVQQGLVAADANPYLLHRNTIDSSVADLKLFEARLGWPISILGKFDHR